MLSLRTTSPTRACLGPHRPSGTSIPSFRVGATRCVDDGRIAAREYGNGQGRIARWVEGACQRRDMPEDQFVRNSLDHDKEEVTVKPVRAGLSWVRNALARSG